MGRVDLLPLFLRCLEASYVHTSAGGDYAIQYDEENKTLYILFEWSDGREDWHHNLAFSAAKVDPEASPEDQWYVHRGFLKVWQAMKEEITAQTVALIRENPTDALVCVGYSHGAALALLATEAMARQWGMILRVTGYGFGSPRVVWGDLPPDVRQRLAGFTTVRNIPDLVTHLPPAAFGFSHVNLMSVGQKGKYRPVEAHTSQAYIIELYQYRREHFRE